MSTFNPFYESGEDILQQIKFLNYDGANGAKVYSTGLSEPRALSAWLQSQGQQCDHLILISYENKTIDESHQNLLRLTMEWNIPGATLRHLLHSVKTKHCQVTDRDVLWQSWTIYMAKYSLENPYVNLAIGLPVNKSTTPLRVLILADRETLPQVEIAVRGFITRNTQSALPEAKSLWLQSLLVGTAVDGWNANRYMFVKTVIAHTTALQKIQQNVSNSKRMQETLSYQGMAQSSALYLRYLADYANAIATTAQQLLIGTDNDELLQAIQDIAKNARQRFAADLDQFVYIGDNLEAELRLCMMAIQINSLDFVRENLISLNQVATSSKRQAEELHDYAKQSKLDTQYMRRLAFLTMFYLPTSTVATMFSMPFLGLDDNLNFWAIGKLWIFILLSMALTGLTFTVSLWWDSSSQEREAKRAAEDERTEQAINTTVETQGIRPRPHVDFTLEEFLENVFSDGIEFSKSQDDSSNTKISE